MRRHLLAAASAILLITGASASAETAAPRPAAGIPVIAETIASFDRADPARRRFGDLEFRGGLVLTSPHRDFGGISAIRVQGDGSRFIAATDRGHWLTGRIVYDGDRPVRLADVVIAPMLGPDGRPLAQRGWRDVEALAQDGETVVAGVERANRILRFDFGRDGVRARGRPIAAPAAVSALPHNLGLECLEFMPRDLAQGGALIAISERDLDPNGNIRGFLIGGSTPGEFSVKRHDGFDVTDCAVLPGGDLLVLERHFTMLAGVSSRLRRVALATLRPGGLVDGPYVLKADMRQEIDNLEGLSVHRAGDGGIVLTLVSDDNFSLLQRTLLLQFTLAE